MTRRNLSGTLGEDTPPSRETAMDSVVDAISVIVTESGNRGCDPDLMVGLPPPSSGCNVTVIVDATPGHRCDDRCLGPLRRVSTPRHHEFSSGGRTGTRESPDARSTEGTAPATWGCR